VENDAERLSPQSSVLSPKTLSIIALGHVHAEDLTPLTPHFERIEELVLDVPPRDEITKHRAEFNRAVDASTNDWLLIVRERERVGEGLAKEVADAMAAAKAWGFRIQTTPIYSEKPLRLGDQAGELRLFHRRHLLRRGEDLGVQGTVVRLAQSFEATTFASSQEHREYLGKTGVPHSGLRHVLLFIRYAIAARTLDKNTLRYLWIEAGFDTL
jgi:hypothetical protein